MSNVLQNFIDGETVPLNASTTSSSAAWVKVGSFGAKDVMIYNEGTVTAFVGFCNSADSPLPVAALPGTQTNANKNKCTPIPAGAVMILAKNVGSKFDDTIVAITRTSTAQLYFTAGQGN